MRQMNYFVRNTAFTMANELHGIRMTSEQEEVYCDPCGSDSKKTSASGFCENCNQFICDSCIKQHMKFAGQKSHTILDQACMPSKKLEHAKTCIQLCDKHPEKIVKYFCTSHKNLICSFCTNLEHRACKLEYIPDVSKNFKENEEYRHMQEGLNTLITCVRTKLSNVTTHLRLTNDMNAIEIGLLEGSLMQSTKLLAEKAKTLIDSVLKIDRENDRLFATVKSLLENECLELREIKLSLSKVEDRDTQLYILAKILVSKLRDKKKLIEAIGNGKRYTFVRFIKDRTAVKMLNTTNMFGRMKKTEQNLFNVLNSNGAGTIRFYNSFLLTSCVNLGASHCGMFLLWATFDSFYLRLLQQAKEPTHVLIRPDGKTFEAFGTEAETTKRFGEGISMSLTCNVSESTMLRDSEGKELKALSVVTLLLKFLYNRLDSVLKEKKYTISSLDIDMVLTLPSTWNETSKVFVKQAFAKAEIDIGRLSFLTESEAAVFYCLQSKENTIWSVRKLTRHRDQGGRLLCVFSKFFSNVQLRGRDAVFVASGVTFIFEDRLDLNLLKVEPEFKMMHTTTEQDLTLGVMHIDRVLERLINSLAECDAMNALKKIHYEVYMAFTKYIHHQLCFLDRWKKEVIIRIPVELNSCISDMTGRSLQQQIEDLFYSNSIQLDQSGFMRVDMNMITPLFDSFVVNVVARIKTFITKKDTIEIDHVIIVSELPLTNLLQQGVKDAFPDMNVFIPRNHDLAILEGGAISRRTDH